MRPSIGASSLRSRLAALACVALVWVLGSCKAPPPQIMLRIETDIPQGPTGVLNAVTIQLINPDTGLTFFENRVILNSPSERWLPGDFAVSWNGRYPIFDARVTAEQRDPSNANAYRALFTVRAIATFPKDDAVTLWIYLANRCLVEENRLCPQGFTCGRLGCEPETRGELPSTRMDASMPEVAYVPPIVDGGAGGCPAGQAPCSGQCVDLQRSNDHCGVCGRSCGAGPNVASGRCELGACVIATCRPGFDNCDGNPSNGCETDIMSPMHCGACGRTCGAMQACSASGCVDSCASGETLCSGACVSTQSSANHCGRCGMACPAGANSRPLCAMGACSLACEGGYDNCDGTASNGCEVNINSDPNHCGMCGRVCAASAINTIGVCSAGRCGTACAPGFMMTGGACVPNDSGVDSGIDAAGDSGVDTGVDTGIDSRADSGVDTGVDAGIDVRTDTGVDTGADVRADVRADVPSTGMCMAGEPCVSSLDCYQTHQVSCSGGVPTCRPSTGAVLPAGTACALLGGIYGICMSTACVPFPMGCTSTAMCRLLDPCSSGATTCDPTSCSGSTPVANGIWCQSHTVPFGRCMAGMCVPMPM